MAIRGRRNRRGRGRGRSDPPRPTQSCTSPPPPPPLHTSLSPGICWLLRVCLLLAYLLLALACFTGIDTSNATSDSIPHPIDPPANDLTSLPSGGVSHVETNRRKLISIEAVCNP